MQGESESVVGPALRFLRETWALEPGGLTTAQALLAFRFHHVDGERARATEALATIARRASFRERPLAVAWAALATGPAALLEPLRSRT